MDLTLEEKEKLAQETIKKELENAENPFVIFDGRMESMVILHMFRQIKGGRVPALYIDTTAEFREIYQFIEKMRKLWGLRLIREKNDDTQKTIKFAENRDKCCSLLKTEALRNAIKKYNIDRLFAFKDENIQTELYITDVKDIMVYPIRHFSREDVRDYIRKYNIPVCSLYDKGYEDIRCIPCTEPPKPKIETEDEAEIKKRLKALGYI